MQRILNLHDIVIAYYILLIIALGFLSIIKKLHVIINTLIEQSYYCACLTLIIKWSKTCEKFSRVTFAIAVL